LITEPNNEIRLLNLPIKDIDKKLIPPTLQFFKFTEHSYQIAIYLYCYDSPIDYQIQMLYYKSIISILN